MTLLNFAIKSAFVTGALTAGAFLTGATIGMLVNKDKVMDKVKKMQIKRKKDQEFNFYRCAVTLKLLFK